MIDPVLPKKERTGATLDTSVQTGVPPIIVRSCPVDPAGREEAVLDIFPTMREPYSRGSVGKLLKDTAPEK